MTDFNPDSVSIFEGRHSVHANACVGKNGIADFETYAVGYFDAARVILTQLLEPKNGLIQDTLVYPVLFNFRHGTELSIKRYSQVLWGCDLKGDKMNLDTHSLETLWEGFLGQAKGDRRLLVASEPLSPVIRQLHDADPSAQEFRYSELKDGAPCLDGKRVIDLATVLELLDYAQPKFDAMFGLVETIAVERSFGSYTSELNREELKQLSLELPDVNTWANSEEFDVVKQKWKEGYGLSGHAFIRAVDFIKEHREFSGNIGSPKEFAALDEDMLSRLMAAAQKLRRFHNQDRDRDDPDYFYDPAKDYFNSAGVEFSAKLVGEVTAIFYHGRDRRYAEQFEDRIKQHSTFPDNVSKETLLTELLHVFRKTSFIAEMCKGLRCVGYPKLAEKYFQLIDDDENRPAIRSFQLP